MADPRAISIVSTAARYPDAASVNALWANALEGRRAFRAIPPERLDLTAYNRLGRAALSIVPVKAGLITDWRFDRAKFRIPAATFEATDLVHWLALDVANEALRPLGNFEGLDRARTAVIVANTLTGEFSRAAGLALRAPFMDELLEESARSVGLGAEMIDQLRAKFAGALGERLPEPNEETLAGGLANTIAGRIANYFDFKGGAFTVDAACASSLVAVAQAADALLAGRADCVLVGAVDLSLDPFELVGFSRIGALATDEMRVFDARSCGFWPGEGAGFAVLMQEDRARHAGLEVLATLRGWGVSTDGAGGLIRPTVAGQVLAIARACAVAGLHASDLDYVEAHGTGTPTGDPVEVRALADVRGNSARPLPIGSIKANIGHTKAAAGFAGLIKTVEALRHGVLAPHVGFERPHRVFAEVDNRVRVVESPERLPEGRAPLAGVSSFGFGGVNAHVILEGADQRGGVVRGVLPALDHRQDVELFLFAAPDRPTLKAQLERLRRRAESLAWSDLADAAGVCAMELADGNVRCAIVAGDVDELARRLDVALESVAAGDDRFDREHAVFIARREEPPRIGFLFPGQAAPVRLDAGAWGRRFPGATSPAPSLGQDEVAGVNDTARAQPAIAAASLAAIQVLERCGLTASVAVGHSLGELTALAWAGALDRDALVQLAADRGRACADHAQQGGMMIRIDADIDAAHRLAEGMQLVIACENGARETVLSGPAGSARAFQRAAQRAGHETVSLPVSHAFHSSMMQGAIEPWRRRLEATRLRPPRHEVVSTVTGEPLTRHDDLVDVLTRQLVAPVRFAAALRHLEGRIDLLVEVGPGRGMARLATGAGFTAVSTDAFSPSLASICETLATAFALGASIDPLALVRDRRLRPIDLDRPPSLLANPCGRRGAGAPPRLTHENEDTIQRVDEGETVAGETLLDVVLGLVARELKLALDAVGPDDRFDTQLNLESLAVARIVARAARATNAPLPRAPTEFAGATSRILAAALAEMRDMPAASRNSGERVDGVSPWIRTYGIEWRPAPSRLIDPRLSWRTVRSGETLPTGSEAALVIDASSATSPDAMAGLVQSVQQAIGDPSVRHLALLSTGAPLSAFARTIALEGQFESVRLISHAPDTGLDLERELAEWSDGYGEVRIGADGARTKPIFTPRASRRRTAPPVGPADVVLVTGGARGIAAECALRLAEVSGCVLILCGRSAPETEDVVAVLQRATVAGLRVIYAQADVLDGRGFAAALNSARRAVGAPTILVHAPGANAPMKVEALTPEILAQTMGPKVDGLENALAAAGDKLVRVYAFGSIIGRIGLEGEAHYALANAWQTERLARFAKARPDCLTLSLEWSVWGGVGMGEQLGVIERLTAQGVDALSLDDALDAFESLVAEGAEGDLVVTSRFGPPPFLDLGPAPLESLRFIDRVLVHYPGVELVVETNLWAGRDPYLPDHRIQGAMILPGVMALEAMAQVARQVSPSEATLNIIDNIAFVSALTVPDGGALAIRICALRRGDGSVEVCIRAADDGFVADRARATYQYGESTAVPAGSAPAPDTVLFSAASLYGPLFFHDGRFRRLDFYRSATSRLIAAHIAAPAPGSWFGALDLPRLVLGDPGARDAALHALQAAVPYRQVAPVSVRRITRHMAGTPVEVVAHETAATADDYRFDLALYDETGDVLETWHGVRFRGIGPLSEQAVLAAAPGLATAYLERLGREALDDASLVVALGQPSVPERAQARADILDRLGAGDTVRRGDGRPWPAGVSLSRGGGGLGVRSDLPIGCDLESLSAFSGDREPPPPLVQAEDGINFNAGDAWVVGEALRKLGRRPPFRLRRTANGKLPGSARLYAARDARIVVTTTPSGNQPVLVAIAVAARRKRTPVGEDSRLAEVINDA